MVWTSLVLNGSSTFARKRRTTTSTTLVSVLNPMSHTCSAISARDKKKNGRANPVASQFRDYLPTIFVWQHYIDNKKVELGRARELQASFTVARKIDGKSGFPQSFA